MALEIKGLAKKYADRWVLRDVSLRADAGEIFGVTGADGAGKSALLRLISGTERAESGSIALGERDLTAASEKDRGMLLIPHDDANGWKSLFKSKSGENPSEAERQKLMLETALESGTPVLLLDNPFSALDAGSLDAAYEKLRLAVKEKNLIVILASNDEEEIFTLCDRVGVLHKGEIVQTGTARELYEKPVSTAVARAMGRCNLISAMRVTFNNQQTQEFQTLTGKHRLRTDKTEKTSLGAITAPVTLAIRPEHISISFGASFPEDNLLKAKIASVQYLGATTRVGLDADGLLLEALVLRLVGLNVGDECLVGMPPGRISVLKD